jgi:hypothetical protein
MVPAAIVVDSGGRVASGVAIGEQNVRALLEWESVEVENDARWRLNVIRLTCRKAVPDSNMMV